MNFIMRNEDFICENCKKLITKNENGGVRNHCNFCLFSKHLDENFPGDRQSNCFGMLKPIGIDNKKNKGWMIKHKCEKCSKEILNKVSQDDNFISFIQKLNANK